jgi:hypothetical protein
MPTRSLSSLFAALTLFAASGAAAQDLAYVEATSELDNGRPATYAYNLVDGQATTAWCSKDGSGPHTIVYGFKKPVQITKLGIMVGSLQGDKLNTKRSRLATLMVSDGQTRREISFDDVAELQEVQLDPPIEGRRFVFDIKSVKPGQPSSAAVCIGELALSNGPKELTGKDVHKALRGVNTPARKLLHSWVDEPSAPERTLVFSLDGTFTYVFEPLLDGDPVNLSGTWRAVGSKKVVLEVKGKKYTLSSRITRIDDGENQTQELRLSGDGPSPSLNSAFRAAPIRYE